MIKRLGLAVLLFYLGSAHAFALIGHPGGAFIPYSDLCSQANVTCAYAYSVVHRLNSTNTTPFTITRTSDSATYNAAYTGASYYVDVAAEEAFCLGNGGTTTVTTYYTTYNDCQISEVFDQASSCNLLPPQANKTFPYRIWLPDGYPVLLNPLPTRNGAPGTTTPWLSNSGAACNAVAGAVDRSVITYVNNSYPSTCCGNVGLMETGSGNPPSYPIAAVNGSMFAQFWYNGGAVPVNTADFCADLEGVGNPPCLAGYSTLGAGISGVGINTYSPTNKYNVFFNNVQGPVNQTPGQTVNTQTRMTIGCDGDTQDCGPVWARDLVVTTNDVSRTVGLPTAIYTYLTNVYAGL